MIFPMIFSLDHVTWLAQPLIGALPGAFCLHGDPWSTVPLREQPQLVERTLTAPVFPWPSWRIE